MYQIPVCGTYICTLLTAHIKYQICHFRFLKDEFLTADKFLKSIFNTGYFKIMTFLDLKGVSHEF